MKKQSASQTMLYKCPGPHEVHGGKFDHIVVDDEQIEDSLAAGWHLTTTDAKEAHAAEVEAAKTPAITPPTRAELEQKAGELKIKFDGRTTDKKLAAMIAAELEA